MSGRFKPDGTALAIAAFCSEKSPATLWAFRALPVKRLAIAPRTAGVRKPSSFWHPPQATPANREIPFWSPDATFPPKREFIRVLPFSRTAPDESESIAVTLPNDPVPSWPRVLATFCAPAPLDARPESADRIEGTAAPTAERVAPSLAPIMELSCWMSASENCCLICSTRFMSRGPFWLSFRSYICSSRRGGSRPYNDRLFSRNVQSRTRTRPKVTVHVVLASRTCCRDAVVRSVSAAATSAEAAASGARACGRLGCRTQPVPLHDLLLHRGRGRRGRDAELARRERQG